MWMNFTVKSNQVLNAIKIYVYQCNLYVILQNYYSHQNQVLTLTHTKLHRTALREHYTDDYQLNSIPRTRTT